MNHVTLRADCAHCAALCCVALAFDRSKLFAFDKQAGTPCAHLSARGACAIHGERERRGFSGCVGYDCLGAGQYVTQLLFAGRSWREDKALLAPMIDAFAIVREIHALLVVLRKLRGFALPAPARKKREALACALEPADGWTLAELKSGRTALLLREARAFVRSLREVIRCGPEQRPEQRQEKEPAL
jgi:hypothetical protein